MGTTADKLDYLRETKDAIRTSLVNKGAEVTEKTPFREYANAVDSIASAGLPEEALSLTGTFFYRFAYNMWNWFIENFGNSIKTQNLTSLDYGFYESDMLEKIPFGINCHELSNNFSYLFYGCKKLKELPRINAKKVQKMNKTFSHCYSLRHIPEDFEDWFEDWSLINNSSQSIMYDLFANCYSLRSFPMTLLNHGNGASYASCFTSCTTLDEVVDLPVKNDTPTTSNAFSNTFSYCQRLKRLTFATDNGVPYKAEWKNQRIDLTNKVGYGDANFATWIYGYNSGITKDKEVKDNNTYQLLKNDPDWFTFHYSYSRYNRVSAIETINSLPDTSEYLLTAGGSNTITFFGGSGWQTDGGNVSALSETEIAVAAAKGWTVAIK